MTSLRALSVVALLLPWSAPAGAAEAAARSEAPAEGVANPLAVNSLDRLSATRERPLFVPSRRAAAAAPLPAPVARRIEPAPPTPPPTVALYGIVLDNAGPRAIIRTGTASRVVRVRIGDDVGGWKVAGIEKRRLVLALNERSATFELFTGRRANLPTDHDTGPAVTQTRQRQRRHAD